MGIRTLQVVLKDTVEGGPGVFFSGNNVTGVVHISVDGESLTAKGVRLECVGKAKVRWSEYNAGTKTSMTYKNKEHYLDYSTNLLGSNAATELSVGNHEFPFSFEVPASIPSSFEGKHGHVRYKVTAAIDDPKKKTEHFFTVLTPHDLNTNQESQLPITEKQEKTLGILFWKSNPISATITIPRTGFVSGEKIPVNAEIFNQSNNKIKDTTLRIIQKVTFQAKLWNKTRTRSAKIVEIKRDEEIKEGGRVEWKNYMVELPPMPTSPFEHCSIISIRTFVELEVNPSGLHRDLVVRSPIIVGSVPLRSTFSNFEMGAAKHKEDATPSNSLFRIYPDLPPPRYNEWKPGGSADSSSDEEEKKNRRKKRADRNSSSSDEEEDEDGAGQGYAPKYMTYNLM